MTAPSEAAVQEALNQVIDPTFDKPMAEIGSLHSVRLDGEKVMATVRLTSPNEELKAKVQSALEAAIKDAGAASLEVLWDIQVPTREVLGDDPVPGIRNVVLVMSGKGGVGKSTSAVNLALALKRSGHRVGILDADIYGPSIPTMMGITGFPAAGEDKKIHPLERFGIKLMSIGFLLEDPRAAVVWRGPMLHGALKQFIEDVHWGELDYLVVDLPPGTGDVALTLAQRFRTTGVVVVTTPQEVALQDVYKGVSMCKKVNLPILGVIENMSYFLDSAGVKHELFGSGGGEKVAEFAEAPLLGQIPMEPQVREWGDGGTPVVQAAPESAPAKVFTDIAHTLVTQIARDHFERSGGKVPAGSGPKRLRIVR